jgi:hypothetical protein
MSSTTVRLLQLHALAYNLGNFLRTLATPEPIKDWSLTSLKEKLIKIGCRLPDGGSSDPKKPLRRRPAAHRRTATAASHVNSMRRPVSRVRQNPQEKCVLIAKSSALSTFDWASACLGAVRRRAGGSQADGSGLQRALKRSQAGGNLADVG